MQSTNATLEALTSGKLKGAKSLSLQANLTHVPDEVFALADSLEILDLNNNQLTQLPEAFNRLKKLKILFCSNNPFSELPSILGKCDSLEMIGFKACQIEEVPTNSLPPQLRWLILTNNRLKTLPGNLGDFKRLQKLMLAGNQLTDLPASLQQCQQLELLRLSANQFSELPHWLYEMPKLAWLALAGNPYNIENETAAINNSQLQSISWQELKLHQQLGEGASGDIFKADWKQSNGKTKAVAVKIFKGEMTSDGLPQSELAAAVTAGSHPHLTATIGLVSNHPEGKQATLMALLDPSYQALANPPSFESCTRDVYEKKTELSLTQGLRIATQVANATRHLHQHGILHGDLYAHNILARQDGNCLLSDFGGASLLPKSAEPAIKLQKIEVRAFGYLLEELIHLLTNSATSHDHLKDLIALKAQCLVLEPDKRPIMSEVSRQLKNIQEAVVQ